MRVTWKALADRAANWLFFVFEDGEIAAEPRDAFEDDEAVVKQWWADYHAAKTDDWKELSTALYDWLQRIKLRRNQTKWVTMELTHLLNSFEENYKELIAEEERNA